MEWNVYIYNINKKRIEPFNIFNHYGFIGNVQKAVSKYKNKYDFESQLRSELFYHYWSKSEWEVIIAPWCGGDRENDAIKVDVYSQVILNWDLFVDYVWEHRKELPHES